MDNIKYYGVDQIRKVLSYQDLILELEQDFLKQSVCVPLRTHEHIAPHKELLIMPAWNDQLLGIKLVSIFSENRKINKETINGLYCLFNQQDGTLLATLDHREITARRTAATSALASSKLSRKDSETLLVLGYGRLAPCLIEAHLLMRPIKQILLWGRDPNKAKQLADRLPYDISIVHNLDQAIPKADIITAATRSQIPLIKGKLVCEGTHIDLVGAYRSDMRETDHEIILRSRLFTDTLQGVFKEGGDFIIPLKAKLIKKEAVKSLSELLETPSLGRNKPTDITLFKSVGTALADLSAVKLIYHALIQKNN